jgi:hypothetical protein
VARGSFLFEEEVLTEEQEIAAIESIAAELNRIAHIAPTPTLEDSCENIALVVKGLNTLCRNTVEALAKLTVCLIEQSGCASGDAQQEVH